MIDEMVVFYQLFLDLAEVMNDVIEDKHNIL